MGKAIAKTLDAVTNAGALVGALLICLVSVIVVYEIVVRALGEPTIWVNEVSIYMFIWSAMLGLALTQKRGEHFRVTILTSHFSPRTQNILQIIAAFAGAVFVSIMFWKGLEMTLADLAIGRLSPTLLHFPIFAIRIAIPLGSFMLLAELLRHAIDLYGRIRVGAD